MCNERYSHRFATGSVGKALDILPHSSKLRYVLPWYCMSREGPASGQNTLHNKTVSPWRKRSVTLLPPLGSRVHVSGTPCGFRGGRNGVWAGSSRGSFSFPLPQISYHTHSFHFICPCDGASDVVGRRPCYS